MNRKKVYQLTVDQEIKALIPPLQQNEYLQLEENLLAEGCREPLVVWKGIIVDGHNRYTICIKHKIPFSYVEKEFDCREAAISWACANQLGRRNITDETRRFLIGKQYETEKLAAAKRNPAGVNQHTRKRGRPPVKQTTSSHSDNHVTARRIANENHIASGTVLKYAAYSRAIDDIGAKSEGLVPNILSGKYKISHDNVLELSQKTPEEIARVGRKLARNPNPFVQYQNSRQEISKAMIEGTPHEPVPAIKNMPEFDPDAEITGLTLTIPSWCSSLDRVRTKTNLSIVSDQARAKLSNALETLQSKSSEMMDAIKEK